LPLVSRELGLLGAISSVLLEGAGLIQSHAIWNLSDSKPLSPFFCKMEVS
jgi:hypothetical protein